MAMVCHEGTAYDTVFKSATVATSAGVLEDVVYLPTVPHTMCGKDKLLITFGTASAAMQWAYDVTIGI